MKDKIKVDCFCLNGFGNVLVQSLCNHKEFEISHLYLREETGPFPYYNIEPLEVLAKKNGLKYSYIPRKGPFKVGIAEWGLVSTFHRIFKPEHILQYNKFLNLHPSILPSYPGKKPIENALENGDEFLGLTLHEITEEVDQGTILFQTKIKNNNFNVAEARKALAIESEKIWNNLLKIIS
jgi:folate-dependent phosphoribosylglycinamide formyltransferase PurN